MKLVFDEDLSVAESIYNDVERTHKGLGSLILFNLLGTLARKATFVIGVSGSGKSRACDALELVLNGKTTVIRKDEITKAALVKLQSQLTNFYGLVIVDDLGNIDTDYMLEQTTHVFVQLCYSHSIVKHTYTYDLIIDNFNGAVIMNVQPIIFRKVMGRNSWNASYRDKCLRFYHLHRPVEPVQCLPRFQVPDEVFEVHLEDVEFRRQDLDRQLLERTMENFLWQYSEGRAIEHFLDLSRAIAMLNCRKKVLDSDVNLLWQLTRNWKLESYATRTNQLEGIRKLDNDFIAIITEIATYKEPYFDEVMRRYGYRRSTFYSIINRLREYVFVKRDSPARIVPTQLTLSVLRDIGELDEGDD